MCGIAGYVTTTPSSEPESLLGRMTNSIRHRGPDGEGFYRDRFASLGHRRLSIIDLETGAQPIANETGKLQIVYNGEIFNHAGLRQELERAGHRYKSRSDTETVLHAYEEYGPACVEKFRGMFAFVIWDRTRQTLFCARDRLGIKPFYYFWDGRLFVFGSEIKVLLEHPKITAVLDESLLSEYLAFGYVSGEKTLFKGIRKLMPGHRMLLTADGPAMERYWDVPRPAAVENWDEHAWLDECRRRLEQTVEMRLMSDVPLGMFLSGGVDSSAIAALMARMVSKPVKTFAVGYQEGPFSELGYARDVAQRIGTEHREVVVSMNDFFGALPKLVWHEDEPITWPSSIPLYFVSKLASEEVKVVLTGEGSDEMFAGYARYNFFLLNGHLMKHYRCVPKPLRQLISSRIVHSRLLSASLRRKLKHSIFVRGENVESLYVDNFYSAFSRSEQAELLSRPQLADGTYDSFLRLWNDGDCASPLARMLYVDMKTYLIELLMKQDQMSMAASIESRVPFLDHPFVEFAATIPAGMKIHGGVAKYIFKRAVEDLLPRDIVYRKKMGFPTPLRDWLMRPESEPLFRMLKSGRGVLASYFNMPVLRDLLDRHRSGVEDATDRVWRLLNLHVWGEIFLGGKHDLKWEDLIAGAPVKK